MKLTPQYLRSLIMPWACCEPHRLPNTPLRPFGLAKMRSKRDEPHCPVLEYLGPLDGVGPEDGAGKAKTEVQHDALA